MLRRLDYLFELETVLLVKELATLPQDAWSRPSTYRQGHRGSIAKCQVFEDLSPDHLVGNHYWISGAF